MQLLITLLLGFLGTTAVHSQSLIGILNSLDRLNAWIPPLNGSNPTDIMDDLRYLQGLIASLQTQEYYIGLLYQLEYVYNDTRCANSISSMMKELPKLNIWPLKFLDATAKIAPGVALGSITYLGSYDECLDIKHPVDDGNYTIKGQYCPVSFNPTEAFFEAIKLFVSEDIRPGNVMFVIRWDICIPDTCSVKTLESFINTSLTDRGRKYIVPSVGTCQKKTKDPYTGSEITALFMLSVMATLIGLGTLSDLILRLLRYFRLVDPVHGQAAKNHVICKVVVAFSFYTNAKKLLKTDETEGKLTPLNGIKFLSMSWIILGHAYFFINNSIIGNLFEIKDLAKGFFFQAILNASVAVDTFFLVSGLLLAYVTLNALAEHQKLNFLYYYSHRFWRLTPAYAFVIIFTLLWPVLGAGPTWFDNNAAILKNCQTHWWASLLYISNLYEPSQMCLGHGWYLACDMQFYVVSPIILLTMHKKPKLGLLINLWFLVTSILITAILGHSYNLPPTSLAFVEAPLMLDFFQKAYITPYCRMGPYCVGLFLGYYLSHERTLEIKMKWHALFWCIAITCNLSVLYGVYNWSNGMVSSVAVNALYLSVHRTIWSLGVAWVILACCTGHGGLVNTILSCKIFGPLGRMTYLAYLIHPLVQMGFSGMLRERLIYNHYEWVVLYLGFLMISYTFAFGASLAVEAPFLALEKLLLTKISIHSTKKPTTVHVFPQEEEAVSESGSVDVHAEATGSRSSEDIEKQD